MKKTLLTILTLILTVTLGVQVSNAIGSLTPSGTPGDATQYTLNDIYTKLTTGTATSTKSGMFTTPGSAVATFRTLTEIYNAIPTIDPATVATGTSYLGVMGTAELASELEWSTDQGLKNIGSATTTCTGTVDGSTGWRLPTMSELITEIENGAEGFILESDNNYWSSTPFDSEGYSLYLVARVNDDYVSITTNDGDTDEYLVRCVR